VLASAAQAVRHIAAMELAREIRAGLQPVVDLVYPPRCPLCGAAIAAQGGLCLDCWSEIEVPVGEGASDGVRAATIYNDVSRQIVLTFKHGGKLALAPLMARMMRPSIPELPAGEVPLLVPVPLHRWRLWERGFNQAALLAGELAKLDAGESCVDALIRRHRTPSLGGLGRAARASVLEGAIALRESRRTRIAGRSIVLIDDVYTSGATSAACARVLIESGARRVWTVCFARVEAG
jgi:ComF family protein